jgi:hypothetical protein
MGFWGKKMGVWFRQWWWVVSFCLITLCVYLHFIREKKNQIVELSSRKSTMQLERTLAYQERESLRLQIHSQSDPSWIEMILMQGLGVVPEGWIKVHFTK